MLMWDSYICINHFAVFAVFGKFLPLSTLYAKSRLPWGKPA